MQEERGMPAKYTPANHSSQAQQWLARVDLHGVDTVLLDPQTDAVVARALDAHPAWAATCRDPELFIYARVARG